ncbi:hypothetical protein NQ176_g344 [Zarea fungicola]|uniref:Uncharacterized protein n=1 Tax=Zarea fungicola TaxID=93591 RepID=A0ACC1NX56_9HYPO|nr:hypothetical protein NQ176_g344 [Lecanicillium fungicola]
MALMFPHAGERLQIAEAHDIVMPQAEWATILQGVEAVFHVAATLPRSNEMVQAVYDSLIEGIRSLLQAVGSQHSIKRFILTGSHGVFYQSGMRNVFDPATIFDENSWNESKEVDLESQHAFSVYLDCKAMAEKMMWRAAEEYTHVDFTSVHPPTVYGVPTDGYPREDNLNSMNANKFIYQLIQHDLEFPTYSIPHCCHVRDVAKAHVRALTAPSINGVKKRFILCAGLLDWAEAIHFLQESRPAISTRLPDPALAHRTPLARYKVDTTLSDRLLGVRPISPKDILLEVIDYLLEWEKDKNESDLTDRVQPEVPSK